MFRTATRPASHLGSIFVSSPRRFYTPSSYKTTSGKLTAPLRILFCGTDELSCESLHALYEEHKSNSALIQKIDVVCLPPRPQGRGRVLSPVPIKEAADALGLPCHQITTFTDWKAPKGTNLIIAVSFGLFVPKRLLRSATYGGLNIHPSFLPDLRGPAPIHHALLRGDSHMGCSLQTMDEEKFDHGVVLAQTPSPGIDVTMNSTMSRVSQKLAIECADLLIQGLRSGVHVPPHKNRGWKAAELAGKPLKHAPKIAKTETRIDWTGWTAEDWKRRLQLERAVWAICVGRDKTRSGTRRVIFHDAEMVSSSAVRGSRTTLDVMHRLEGSGEEVSLRKHVSIDTKRGEVYILLKDHVWVRCRRATLEGKPERTAGIALKDLVGEQEDGGHIST